MKTTFKIMVIVASIIILVIIGIGKVNSIVYINKPLGIPSRPLSIRLNADLYFPNPNELLEKESRTIVVKDNDFVNAIIKELQNGPTNEDLYTVLSSNIRVLNSSIVGNKLYLNLSKDVIESTHWQNGFHDLILWSLVNTLTEVDNIERVQIKIDGKDLTYYLEGSEKYGILSKNDHLVYDYADNEEEYVRYFLNLIVIERYDLAYEMLSSDSKIEISFKDFTLAFTSFRNKISDYQIQDIRAQKNQTTTVYVEYELISGNNVIKPQTMIEYFYVSRSEGEYRMIMNLLGLN